MSPFIPVSLILAGSLMFIILYAISLQPESLSLRSGPRAYRICGAIRYIAILFEFIVLAGYILFTIGGRFNPPVSLEHSLSIRIIGSIFALVTISFMTWATLKAGKESAAPRTDTGLHHGIYDSMRHPQTLGEMLSWIGISMILNSLPLLLYSFLWIPVFIGFTVLEDNDLSLRFGDEYLRYCKKVGLFWRKRKVHGD